MAGRRVQKPPVSSQPELAWSLWICCIDRSAGGITHARACGPTHRLSVESDAINLSHREPGFPCVLAPSGGALITVKGQPMTTNLVRAQRTTKTAIEAACYTEHSAIMRMHSCLFWGSSRTPGGASRPPGGTRLSKVNDHTRRVQLPRGRWRLRRTAGGGGGSNQSFLASSPD